MGVAEIIAAIMMLAVTAVCITISLRSFKEKGFLFNNTYIWANAVQRKKLNKKPYYRQSAVIFAILSVVFASEALDLITGCAFFSYLAIALCLCAAAYAVMSEIRICRDNKKDKTS